MTRRSIDPTDSYDRSMVDEAVILLLTTPLDACSIEKEDVSSV